MSVRTVEENDLRGKKRENAARELVTCLPSNLSTLNKLISEIRMSLSR